MHLTGYRMRCRMATVDVPLGFCCATDTRAAARKWAASPDATRTAVPAVGP